MYPIPDFETPEQYKARTGKKWNGAVWFRWKLGDGSWSSWYAVTLISTKEISIKTERQILCAQSPNPPPDDWEEG
jgi:hypothetical protein